MLRGLPVLLLLIGCASPVQVESLARGEPVSVQRIALVPCRLDPSVGETVDAVTTPAQAAGLVTARLLERLLGGERFDVVPPGEVARALEIASLRPDEATPEAIGAALRTAFGADAVLRARLRRFHARIGGEQGAHRPAAVRFELELHSADGVPLWRGVYDETQRGLSDDPRALQRAAARGFRFVPAEELVAYGADELVRALEEAGAAWR